MICNLWDIVVVPFPFVEGTHAKPRPALVLSQKNFNEANHHTVLAMITTGANTSWKSDIHISRIQPTGLQTDSVIRMKIFTLDNRLLCKIIGNLHMNDQKQVKEVFQQYIV